MTNLSNAVKRETAYSGGSLDESMPSYLSYSGYPIWGVDLGAAAAAQPSPYDHMPL
jgi:hypothetical protein